jgi:uracil-DNA glycosylase
MSELELFFLMLVFTRKFNIVDLVIFLGKKSQTSHLDRSGHVKGDIMQNHEQKKKWKKWNTKILWAQQTSFLAPCPSALGQL